MSLLRQSLRAVARHGSCIPRVARANYTANVRFMSVSAALRASAQGSTSGTGPAAASLGSGFANLAQTKVKQIVKDDDGNELRVSISQNAADKLNLISQQDKNPDLMLRIVVESGGCHGFQYIFALRNRADITEDDGVFERQGAMVVIDSTSLEVLRDSTVDYATELIGSQFKVTSPYTDSTCGCGTSFSFDPSKIPTSD